MNMFDNLARTLAVTLTAVVCLLLCWPATAAAAGPGSSVSAYDGSLSKALQAIGTQEATLVIDTPATVDGDTTTPATLGLVFRKGGRINVGDHTVRINGPIEAGPYTIFEGTGQVTIADNAVAHLYVEWWGGAADGTTDNTPAFAAAMSAMSTPTIQLLQGTYLGVVAAANKTVTLKDSGKWKTTIKNNVPTAHTISLRGSPAGTMISDLKVDMNGAEETGILLVRCNYADVERIGIVGQGGTGKYALHLSNCTLSSFKDVMFGDRNEGHLAVAAARRPISAD